MPVLARADASVGLSRCETTPVSILGLPSKTKNFHKIERNDILFSFQTLQLILGHIRI